MKIIRFLRWLAPTLLAVLSIGGCEASERSPYPVITSDLVVPDGEPAFQVRNFRWLDNDRVIALVVDRIDVVPKGYTKVFQSLKVWDVASNTVTTLAEPNVGGLCVGEGFIRYYVKRTGENGKEVLDRYFGPVGQVKLVVLSGPLDSLTCKLKSEVRLPDWALAIPDINIRRLRPEHGFLVIDRDNVTQWPRSIRLFPPGGAIGQAVDLSKILGDRPINEVPSLQAQFYEYMQAYYISAVTPGLSSWWLFPDGRLEQVRTLRATDLHISTRTLVGRVVPTKIIPIAGANAFEKSIGDDGLYSIADPMKPKRLVKGRITKEIEVSPDGCKAAFGNDRRDSVEGYRLHKLEIMNLCEEK